MDKKFINSFNKLAKQYSFEFAFGAYFKVHKEVIIVLNLQKSNFGNYYYYLNIKWFIQGSQGRSFSKSKELAKKEPGQVRLRPNETQLQLFDLDLEMSDESRISGLEKIFTEFLIPITTEGKSREGILKLFQENKLYLDSHIKKELEEL